MLAVVDKIAALFAALTPTDVRALPPAERRRLADLCRHWAGVADRPNTEPANGVLAQLKADGRQT